MSNDSNARALARGLLPLSAVLVMLVLGLVGIDDTLSRIRGGDAASYVVLTRAIATGQGFSDIHLPGSPSHTQYPPFLPLLLSPVFYFWGYAFSVMSMVTVLFGCAAVYVSGRFVSALSGPLAGGLVAVLTATNYHFVIFACEVMTEVPYAFFSILFLLLLREASTDARARAFATVLPVVLATAYFTRMIGVTLLAGSAVFLAVRALETRDDRVELRGWVRKLVLLCAEGAVPFAAWYVRGELLADDVSTYGSIFMQADYYAAEKGAAGLGAFFDRFAMNTSYYIEMLPFAVLPFSLVEGYAGRTGYLVLSLIVLGVVLAGYFHDLWFQRDAKDFYVLIYFALLSVWPVYGKGDALRYVVPVIPLVYYYLLRGASVLSSLRKSLCEPWRAGMFRGAVVAGVVFFALNFLLLWESIGPVGMVSNARAGAASVAERVGGERVEELGPALLGAGHFVSASPCFERYLGTADMLTTLMGPDDLVMTRKPEIVYLASHRMAVRFPYTSDQARMEEFIERSGVDYVLIDGCYSETKMYLAPFLAERPEEYKIVASDKQGTVVLKRRGESQGEAPAG